MTLSKKKTAGKPRVGAFRLKADQRGSFLAGSCYINRDDMGRADARAQNLCVDVTAGEFRRQFSQILRGLPQHFIVSLYAFRAVEQR